jgi:hypothetical protein
MVGFQCGGPYSAASTACAINEDSRRLWVSVNVDF